MTLLLSDPDELLTGWFNENHDVTVLELISRSSMKAYAFFRTWSQNDSHEKFVDAVRAQKEVEFFKFVFEPIGHWKTSFLERCVSCLIISNNMDPRKETVDTSGLTNGVDFDQAWNLLMQGPLMEVWSATGVYTCLAAFENLGREVYVHVSVVFPSGVGFCLVAFNKHQRGSRARSKERWQANLEM